MHAAVHRLVEIVERLGKHAQDLLVLGHVERVLRENVEWRSVMWMLRNGLVY